MDLSTITPFILAKSAEENSTISMVQWVWSNNLPAEAHVAASVISGLSAVLWFERNAVQPFDNSNPAPLGGIP